MLRLDLGGLFGGVHRVEGAGELVYGGGGLGGGEGIEADLRGRRFVIDVNDAQHEGFAVLAAGGGHVERGGGVGDFGIQDEGLAAPGFVVFTSRFRGW